MALFSRTPKPAPDAATPTKDAILDVLRRVKDPDLNRDIVSLGFVTQVAACDGAIKVTINLTTPACPVKDQMKSEAERLIRELPGVQQVNVEMTAVVAQHQGPPREFAKGVKHLIAVSSGKGGVGKSTVTVNLAAALHKAGARVGILDCDVYGPDIPMMMGLAGEPEAREKRLVPKERFGIKTMSLGYLVPEEKPVIWRGPMLHKLIEQFLADVDWGELDYLLVDMPPGTGDAQLSLAQIVPLTGAVLVTTPQAVSAYDVTKAIAMFGQVNVPVLGIVENMAGYAIEGRVEGAGPGTKLVLGSGRGEETLELGPGGRFRTSVPIFGAGGAERLAARWSFPVLGRVPLDPAVRVGGDAGDPVTLADPSSAVAQAFQEIGGRVAQEVAKRQFFLGAGGGLPVLQ
jgi:ATP-binding protein involved in chromosome partitioning